MQRLGDALVLSASDLTGFAACGHLTQLELSVVRGECTRPTRDDPMLDVLTRRGGEHEERHLVRFHAEGRSVVAIEAIPFDTDADVTRGRLADAEAETLAAMLRGEDVIYQATFFDGRWRGHADFLFRVDTPSPELGPWSYEVADTKLARRVKAGALLQMCHYSEHVARLQGVAPVHMHVITGDGERHTEKVRDYAAYYRHLKQRFETVVADAAVATYPNPVEHCGVCRWGDVCSDRRRADDHLSLVAGMRSDQARKLVASGIVTRTALGNTAPDTSVDGMSTATFDTLRAQANLQVRGEGVVPQLWELLPPERPKNLTIGADVATELASADLPDDLAAALAGDAPWPKRGFAALPPPSPGDLFFDVEGDPYALDDGGLEYLFGVVTLGADGADGTDGDGDGDGGDAGEPEFRSFWGHDRAQEKAAFEAFIDFVMARLDEHPDLHVYHYAPYEVTAMKRLMGLHGTREHDVDELLRGERFVDLYAVVRQGVRVGTESYSLKQIEKLYMERDVGEIAEGAASIVAYESYLEDHDQHRLDEIERYNADDCRSTLGLRDWLEARRVDAEERYGPIPRPEVRSGEASDDVAARDAEAQRLADALTDGVPAKRADRSDEQQARWLLAQLLGWHRREDKPEWWSYFHRIGYENDDDFLDDRECIGGLRHVRKIGADKRSTIHEYAFDPQDHKFRVGGEPVDPATGKGAGEIVGLDDASGRLRLRRGPSLDEVAQPTSLIPATPVNSKVLETAVNAVARAVLADGIDAPLGDYRAARDLLLRRPPRVLGTASGEQLAADGESGRDATRRLVPLLDRTYLAVQGPPGSGKTTVAAAAIVDRVEAGDRIGITAHSHAVIGNLLEAVVHQAGERGVEVRALQRSPEGQHCGSPAVACAPDNKAVQAAIDGDRIDVIGGTSYLWARDDMRDTVDVLFVDEAGQKSLADVVAMSGASANSIVLLGDPQQLAQPSHGSHPEGAGVSALEHVIGDHQTMPEEYGLFLATTHRMHPEICAFVSEIAYDEKLFPEPGNERQTVDGEAGLRWVPVEHHGNRSSSPEEAEVVAQLVAELVGKEWTDREGRAHELTIDDILVVTPYNAQVAKLTAALPVGARVGTVDKFQGREAPVVIYSLATSSAEDVPRSMEFLYDLHRLNVAVSRAQALTYVVASPALLDASCRSPKQLHFVSAACRFSEFAER